MIIDNIMEQKQFDKFRFESLVKARDNLNTSFHLWMTFFTVAIGALFVGYYTMQNNEDVTMEIAVVSLLGYFVSLLWHWSCKGYYWWNINWINLIMDCERNLLPRCSIYSCFINKDEEGDYYNPLKPANISTSKLLGLFSFVITIVWGILILNHVPDHFFYIDSLVNFISDIFCVNQNTVFCLIYITVSFIFSMFLCCFAVFLKNDIRNHKDIKLEHFLRQ